MSTQELRDEIPSWLVGLVTVLFIGSFVYGIIVRASIIEPIEWWIEIIELAFLIFIVYLLYRFVIAVETIADKQ